MRVMGTVLAAALALTGCSGDTGGTGGRTGGNTQTGRQLPGAAGTSGTGTGAGDGFGNSPGQQGVSSGSGSGGMDTTGGAVGDGGMCQSGQFCAPSGPDPTDCGSLTLDTNVKITTVPGNVLVIFDQSASMEEAWGSTTKLAAAQQALVDAFTPLLDKLTIGAIFLPTYACVPLFPPPDGGAVAPIEDPSQINFMPGPQFIQAWNAKWQNVPGMGIGTPLNEAFDRADVALQNGLGNMSLMGNIAVIAFTDGDPNCFPDAMVDGIPTKPEPDHAADWLAQGIKTYMVGLPGAAGATVLDQIAMSGGTMTYITPDDPMQLEDKIKQIVQEQIKTGFDSCSIDLTPAADPVDKLQLVATEQVMGAPTDESVPHDLMNGGGGWTITADGSHVELTGSLCDDAKNGRFDSLKFKYGCKELPPLPPVAPPD